MRTASPSISPRGFVNAAAVWFSVFFCLRFTYLWLDDVVRDRTGTFLPRLLEEGTGSLGAFMLSWFVYRAWCVAPLRVPELWTRVPGYLALGLAISATNTSFMWASRSLLFPALGLGPYDYGRMPLRYLMEAPGHLIGYATLLGALALLDEANSRRAHAVAHVELKRALAESQLQNLRLQLQPHFLFNALNTISSQLHEDPVIADRLIGRLAALLRASLHSTDGAVVQVRDELELLNAYADLMRARFGARLVVTVDVDPSALDAKVPPVLLQPLLENAIQHGGLERVGSACVRVEIRCDATRLRVRVHDDGPGLAAGRDPFASGTGLSTTARRLELLHGDDARIRAENEPGGGFAVTIELPGR